ncbi:MAG: beta-lactamase family protein [Clostridia bacterium]|nr:beta-lactamase family protein [Clostridia bacterium]
MSAFHECMVGEVRRQQGEGIFYSVVTLEEPLTPGEGLFHMEKTDFRPGNPAHDCYSVAKSVSAAAAGILCDRGLLRMTDTLGQYLGAYLIHGTDPKWGDLTVDLVCRHRTGAAYGVDYDMTNAHLWADPEWLHTLFAIPVTGTPGREFVYSDASYYILGRIVEKITGMDMEAFLQKELFVPLGCHVNAWSRDVNGHTVGGTGLYLRTEDMAKIGWLYMNDGLWGERRIFSEAWSRAQLDPPADEITNYGYGMCRIGNEMWGAGGMYNQGFQFDKAHRRVVAWHAFDDQDRTRDLGHAFRQFTRREEEAK